MEVRQQAEEHMPSRDLLTGRKNSDFSISGGQFGVAGDEHNGKTKTQAAPMIINSRHAGEMLENDSLWKTTFGASMDAFLSLMNGNFLKNSVDEISLAGIFKDALTNADDDNIYKKADDVQQIQYVVSKNTADEATDGLGNFGEYFEARGLGLRVPSIAVGWGRKTNLRPTDPQPGDDENLRKNDDAHKLDRSTWKHGPIDLRWDPKRGVWAAFNDMIADHNNQGIGTWVFGTNNDTSNGFPFIRGRWEDVFWVRQTKDYQGSSAFNDDSQTGEVLTHLNHKWFDEDENGAASLKSIFIIPHTTSTDPDCHPKGEEHQVGDELTGVGERIDIRTTVHFFKEKGIDGPIAFCGIIPEEKNTIIADGNFIKGQFVFDPDECKWVPTVLLDECEIVGGHFKKLIQNDGRIAKRVTDICNRVSDVTTNMAAVINDNSANLASVDSCIMAAINGAVKAAVNAAFSQLATDITLAIEDTSVDMADEVNNALSTLTNDFNIALLECGCPQTVDAPSVTASHYSVNAPTIDYNVNCTSSLTRADPLDCNDCHGVYLNGPCMNQPQYFVGNACGGTEEPNITTNYGTAQFHDPEPSEITKEQRPLCDDDND